LRTRPSPLQGIRIEEAEVPALIDEVPLLACLAAGCGVELEVSGAAELRVKESDRITTVVDNLVAIGAEAEELPDGLRVHGRRRAFSGTIDAHGDHRVAMAFGVLGAVRGNRIMVKGAECVAVSYPRFWDDLARAVA
jgi:3-phosphoshikimate 1-carboxyvinyltransferase